MAYLFSFTTRLELKFKANSESPLKWTGICYIILLSRLILRFAQETFAISKGFKPLARQMFDR
jgi:hypothetical protein